MIGYRPYRPLLRSLLVNNSQLVQEALPLLEQLTAHQITMASASAVAHLLHDTPSLQSRLIAPRRRADTIAQANILHLFQQIHVNIVGV